MVKKWKGINEIVENATKELIETKEDNHLFYTASEEHKLFLSIVPIGPLVLRTEIKDFGIDINGKKDGILRRGFTEGDVSLIIDDDRPLLELVEERKIGFLEMEIIK